MTSKEFLNHLKRLPEKDAVAILENMNLQAVRMATEISELEESVSSELKIDNESAKNIMKKIDLTEWEYDRIVELYKRTKSKYWLKIIQNCRITMEEKTGSNP